MKLKSIEALHNKYKDQNIVIFATGPSLLEVNPDDYKGMIRIGINYAFEKVPVDYTCIHEYETFSAIKKLVDNESLIIPYTLNKHRKAERMRVQNKKAFYYEVDNPTEKELKNKKEITLEKEDADHIFCFTSTTQSAIHIAAYMGAKRIILVGVDYKLFPDGKVHFKSQFSEQYSNQDWNVFNRFKQGDEFLIKKLAEKGVEVQYYNQIQQIQPTEEI